MSVVTQRVLFIAGFLLVTCAPVASKPPPPPAALPPLPRSSIAAVLEHRNELELEDDQVLRLQDMDESLEVNNAALRAQFLRDKPDAGGAGHPHLVHGDSSGSTGAGAGMGGPGMGGGGMGGRGGRRGGDPSGYGDEQSEAARYRHLLDQIDNNDTRAYLEAEELLTDAQKPRARAIATKYRADLSDRREATKAK
jgi:hypothetical protein